MWFICLLEGPLSSLEVVLPRGPFGNSKWRFSCFISQFSFRREKQDQKVSLPKQWQLWIRVLGSSYLWTLFFPSVIIAQESIHCIFPGAWKISITAFDTVRRWWEIESWLVMTSIVPLSLMNHVVMPPWRLSISLHTLKSLNSFWTPFDDCHDGDDDGDNHKDNVRRNIYCSLEGKLCESKDFWLLASVIQVPRTVSSTEYGIGKCFWTNELPWTPYKNLY